MPRALAIINAFVLHVLQPLDTRIQPIESGGVQ